MSEKKKVSKKIAQGAFTLLTEDVVDSFAPAIVLRVIFAVTEDEARVVLPRMAATRRIDDNMVTSASFVVCGDWFSDGTRKQIHPSVLTFHSDH